MAHMIIELILWMLLAFFVGCLIGYLARQLFGSESVAAPDAPAFSAPGAAPGTIAATTPAAPPLRAKVEAERSMEPTAAAAPPPPPTERADIGPDPVPAAPRSERPLGIAQPRDGIPDNLQRISGIGPKNERTLHSLGFYHYDQIAAWSVEQVEWVDNHLKFNGRIGREQWVVQADLLATGREDDFLRQFGTGGVKPKSGDVKSGTRTRKS